MIDTHTTRQHDAGQRLFLVLAIAVLLGGFALRVWQLNTESIWHDEGWSIRAINDPINTPDDNTPVVYYAVGHILWRLGTGETPFSYRFASVLIGLLTVAVTLLIARRWYGPAAGGVAGSLVAISPLLWEYSQEVRAYVAVPLVALMLLGLAEKILRYRHGQIIPRRLWAAILVVEILGLYTHNLVVPVVVWLSVAMGLAWLSRQDWRRLWNWFWLHLLMVAAYLPWLSTQSPSGTPLNTVPQWGSALVQDIWYSYFLPALPQLQETADHLLLDLAGIVTILAAMTLLVLDRSRRAWLLLSQAGMVPLFSTVLLRQANIDFHPRYYIAVVPATLLLIVGGAVVLQSIAGRRIIVATLSLVVVAGGWLTVESLSAIQSTRRYQHDDFAALANYYVALPPEAVILVPYDREPALQDYYAARMGIQARFVNIPLHSDEGRLLETLTDLIEAESPSQVAFLTWFQLPADTRGMYPCILAGGSQSIGAEQTFFGLATQTYTLDTKPVFQPIPAAPRYERIRLEDLGWISASAGEICVRSRWELLQTPDEQLNTVVRLLNSLGWELSQVDAVLRDREQVPADQMAAGDTVSSYHRLQLPPAAPEDGYPLTLSVYSETFPHGLDVLSPDGAPIGVNYRPDTAIVASGPPLDEAPASSQLVSDNAGAPGTLDSAQPLHVTVLIVSPETTATIALVGDDWVQEQSVKLAAPSQPQRSWHRFQLPPEPGEKVRLEVNGHEIATYDVVSLTRQFDLPAYETPLDVVFPEIGTLVGATVLNPSNVSSEDPPAVELIWRAAGPTERSYVAFVQLLDTSGRLLAQSDQIPAAGQRPTTGWAPDEVIVDNHRLTFRVEDYEGAAYLIAGLYDPQSDTLARILAEDGADHARLPVEIIVEE